MNKTLYIIAAILGLILATAYAKKENLSLFNKISEKVKVLFHKNENQKTEDENIKIPSEEKKPEVTPDEKVEEEVDADAEEVESPKKPELLDENENDTIVQPRRR
jgi:hypothetical protein